MNEVEKSTEKSWLKTNPEKGLWSYLVIQNNYVIGTMVRTIVSYGKVFIVLQ